MEYAASDSRIQYVRQEQNIGHQANFDYVAGLASTEYFMWASADDFWQPEFAERLISVLDAERSLIAASGAITRVDPDGNEIDTVRFSLLKDLAPAQRLRLAVRIAAGYSNRERYHLLLYSMFRTTIIRQALAYSAVHTVYPDRTFMCQFALAGRIAYLEPNLMLKTYQTETLDKRYPEESFGKSLADDPWALLKSSLIVAPFLIRSPAVSTKHKILVPVVTFASLWGYRNEIYRGDSTVIRVILMPHRMVRRIARLLLR